MRKSAILLVICLLFGMSLTGFAQSSPTFYEEYGIWFDKDLGAVTGFEEGLTQLTLPSKLGGKKVELIGEKAFFECTSLQSVSLPSSVKKIESLAFAGCTALEEIRFSDGLESIGSEAFAQCQTLTELNLPSFLEEIGQSAFVGCSGLTEVTLPGSLKQIGENSFSYCEALTRISISDRNQKFSCADGVLFDKGQTTLLQYPGGKEESEYTLPETVTTVGMGAFSYCNQLTRVILPQGLTSVGEYAFFNCDSLKEISLPDKVTSIGKEAFGWCDSLERVVLPANLTKIEYGLFWYAKNLKEIVIPHGVTSIGDDAFASCETLKKVTFPQGLTTIGEESFANCTLLSELILPESVQKVGNKAFSDTGLLRITAKNGETNLSQTAFDGCGPLQFFSPEHTPLQQYAYDRGDQWEKIVTVTYLGKEISFDQPPVTRFDRTLVPVRAIFETMGATVDWDEETLTVTAVRGDRVLSLQIDNTLITINGETVELDVPAQQINDRTLVPVRAVADGLNCDVYWDEQTQTVSIWEKNQ